MEKKEYNRFQSDILENQDLQRGLIWLKMYMNSNL